MLSAAEGLHRHRIDEHSDHVSKEKALPGYSVSRGTHHGLVSKHKAEELLAELLPAYVDGHDHDHGAALLVSLSSKIHHTHRSRIQIKSGKGGF